MHGKLFRGVSLQTCNLCDHGDHFSELCGGLPGDSLRDKRLQNGKYPTFVFKRGVIRSLWVVVRQP